MAKQSNFDMAVFEQTNVKNKIWFKAAQALLFLLLVFFIGRLIYRNWQEITRYGWSLNFFYLALTFFLLLIQLVPHSIAWQRLVLLTGEKLSIRSGFRIMVLSAIGRYLPGGIWDHVGRFTLAKREYGLEGKRVFLSVVLNIVLNVLAAVVVFLLSLLLFSEYQNLKFLPYCTAIIPLGFIIIYPPLLEKLINIVLPRLGKQKLELPFTYLEILRSTSWFFLSWMIIGSALFSLIYAFSPTRIALLPVVSGIYAISWVVGFLTPIAPNGAGVREASLILLLGAVIPLPVAIVSTLSFRLLIITRDLVSAAIGAQL